MSFIQFGVSAVPLKVVMLGMNLTFGMRKSVKKRGCVPDVSTVRH